HAPRARHSDCLAINVVLNIAGGKDSRNISIRSIISLDVTHFIHFEMPAKQSRIRRMADADKDPVERLQSLRASPGVSHFDAGHLALIRIQNVHNYGVPQRLDLLVAEQAVLHDFRSAELVAAMNEQDLVRESGEKQRLFGGRVSAADDRDVFIAKEISVAGGARRNPVPNEFALGLEAQQPRRGPGSDDQRASFDFLLADIQDEWAARKVGKRHVALQKFRAENFRLFLHKLDQFRLL